MIFFHFFFHQDDDDDDDDWEDEEEDMIAGGAMKNLLGSVFAPAADYPGKIYALDLHGSIEP